MRKNINTKRGQAIIEYVGFIAMVTLALFVISTRSYLQRVVQGRWKDNVGSVSDIQYSSGSSYNVTQGNWQMDVRTASGQPFLNDTTTIPGYTVWYLPQVF